jgi:hypothetical protein
MPLSTCPSEIAKAPPRAVWSVLADPRRYRDWVDAHLVSFTPTGGAVPGQRLLFRAPTWGRWFRLEIVVENVDATNHVLELTTRFPFGLSMRNRIAATALNAEATRVQFG